MHKIETFQTADGVTHPSIKAAVGHEQAQLENFLGKLIDKAGMPVMPKDKLRLMELLVPSVISDKLDSPVYVPQRLEHLDKLIKLAENYRDAIKFMAMLDEDEEVQP